MIEQFSDRFNRKDFTSTDERVTKEVPGLYAGVTTDKTHANWEFADDFQITPGPTITTWAIDPKGNRGKVIRTFNAAAGKLDLEQAFLEKVDRWIPAGTGLSAKGVPTIDYVTIRQMKLWEGEIRKDSTLSGAYPGGLHGNVREVSIHSIVNKRSRIELWGNMRNGDNAVTAAMKTNTFAYSVRSLIQSGHEIIPGTVTVSPADPFLYCTRIGRSRETWLADAEKKLMDETFARFNPTMDTQMPDGFAIALKLRKRR